MEDTPSIQWQDFEYEHRQRSTDWFWILWILSIIIIFVSVYYNNILLAILVFLATLSITLYSVKKPELINFELNNKGIFIKKDLHPYFTLESFWVEYEEEEEKMIPKIILKSKKILTPHIIIPLGNSDPKEIREFLVKYLREIKHEEPLLHHIATYFGF